MTTMTKTIRLPDDVLAALEQARRTAGWNNRRGDVQTFALPNPFGHEPCVLYVVPARRWAYRRWEQATAAYWREQGTPRGAA